MLLRFSHRGEGCFAALRSETDEGRATLRRIQVRFAAAAIASSTSAGCFRIWWFVKRTTIAGALEPFVAVVVVPGLAFFVMLSAVGFDDELCLGAVEIYEVRAELVLATEFEAAEATAP